MNFDWACDIGIDPGWATVIGGTFVMVAAYQATRQADRQRSLDLHERQNSIKTAIAAEARLVANQIRDRNWIASLEGAISEWDRLKMLPGMGGPVIHTPLSRNFMKIYEANLQSIALLGRHTRDVTEFYARLEAAIEVNELLKDLMAKKSYLEPGQGHKLMEILKNMLADVAEIGERLSLVLEHSIEPVD